MEKFKIVQENLEFEAIQFFIEFSNDNKDSLLLICFNFEVPESRGLVPIFF